MKTLDIANKDGFRFGEQAYLVGNEYGLKCVAYARNEQEALDYAVDEGFMQSEIMSWADYMDHQTNGWHDSWTYAGNASEPIWSQHLWIKPASDRKQ